MSTIIGILVIILACSFTYKFYRAAVLGKLDYWSGFLPFSLVSPLFTHIRPKPGQRSLVKETTGLWIHLIMGPVFLIVSVLLFAAGFELAGLPGMDTLNYVINGGNRMAPMAVTYDRRFTFRFPVLIRAVKQFAHHVNRAQIPLPEDQRMINNQEMRAKEDADRSKMDQF